MKEIWTKTTAEYNGEIVKVPSMRTWPKPTQKPHPPILLGGAFPWAARRAIRYGDGRYPNASSGNPNEYMPRFRQMATEAGLDPLPVESEGWTLACARSTLLPGMIGAEAGVDTR
jgi:alkanesulfonate monooxygenase SsuD/methylene tetrahydromethanopterin reductase-like flavin-dependent oxidoreductase (luciferase family)